MTIGRKEPCPCGSGRKYKRCCYRKDVAALADHPDPNFPPAARAEALASDRWEVDLLSLPSLYPGSDDKRPVLALLTAGGAILHLNLMEMDASEPPDLAAPLQDALTAGATLLGEWPATVAVRRAEIADVLRPHLEARGCDVEVVSPLPNLDATAREFLSGALRTEIWPPIGAPHTWAGWGLPADLLSNLFSACAQFYRATPWRWMEDFPPVLVEWKDGSGAWLVAVLGAAGVSVGVGVYSDPSDYYDGMLNLDEGDLPFQDMAGWITTLVYGGRDELPDPMQREILRAGWEVAGTEAYPLLMPLLTPGGGVSSELAHRLALVLHALASFADEHRGRLQEEPTPFTWETDELVLVYEGDGFEHPRLQDLPPILQGIQEKLESGEVQSIEEAQAWANQQMDSYNTTPQAELSGLSPDQAQSLLEGDWKDLGPLSIAEDLAPAQLRDVLFLTNARIFLKAVMEHDGVPATKAGNLQRVFVAEMLDGMKWSDDFVERVRAMNKTINEEDVWQLHLLRVVLGVSGLLNRRKGKFRVTRMGQKLMSDEKAGALLAHLFRTFFRKFNLSYMDRDSEAPNIQHGVPILLWRIGATAREWVATEELAAGILPEALRTDPSDPPVLTNSGWSRVRTRIIEPLVSFGVMEERVVPGSREPWWNRKVEVRVTPLFDQLLRFRWE